MKTFIYKILTIVLIVFVISSIRPIMGLYWFYKNCQLPKSGSLVNIKSSTPSTPNKILVIGCSNLEHNINHKKVQQIYKNVDFLYFAGTLNATYLQYLVDNDYTKEYKYVILYAPYQLIQKAYFLHYDGYTYKSVVCYSYITNIIKHDPILFFYNWSFLIDSVKKYRDTLNNTHFISYQDTYMDYLNDSNAEFRNCTAKFNHARQIVDIPVYTEKDVNFIKSLNSAHQKYFIMFSPIPNIKENIAAIGNALHSYHKFKNCLNQPFLVDSSYSYDQWYHMNKCGQEIETNKMLKVLSGLN